ncbi:MAG: hypothetical protein ABS75_07290 [Pelagibacterium sp. SCN 63-23]|nr:MAG: hypothetical protein ABS75_07290 [Pelagibacterium sp. SCN 63-23]
MWRNGVNPSGQPLWTPEEISTLKANLPGYREVMKKLKRRSYFAVRHKTQSLGLAPKRHIWTAAEISKLRKLYGGRIEQSYLDAFPGVTRNGLQKVANYYNIFRPKKPYEPTGHPLIDQIRARALELGYTMADVDKLARSNNFFAKANWHSGSAPPQHLARAVAALGGRLKAEWDD